MSAGNIKNEQPEHLQLPHGMSAELDCPEEDQACSDLWTDDPFMN
jgi:hypothetical protein